MAKNILGGETPTNYARGDSPPVGSYEWAAAGGAPAAKKVKATEAKKTPVIVATMRETIILEKKPRRWKWLGIGAAVGAVAAYFGLRHRG